MFRSFQRGTASLYKSKGCNDTSSPSWSFENLILLHSPPGTACRWPAFESWRTLHPFNLQRLTVLLRKDLNLIRLEEFLLSQGDPCKKRFIQHNCIFHIKISHCIEPKRLYCFYYDFQNFYNQFYCNVYNSQQILQLFIHWVHQQKPCTQKGAVPTKRGAMVKHNDAISGHKMLPTFIHPRQYSVAGLVFREIFIHR